MTKSSSNGSGNGSGPFSFPLFPEALNSFLPLSQIRVNGGLPMSPVLAFARTQARLMSKWGNEVARFAERRLDRDEKLFSEMASCDGWDGLAERQAAWAAEALKDYMQEAGELMELLRGAYSEEAKASKKAKPAAKPKAAAPD